MERRYAADLAQRQYMLVDPNNRLVTDILEHEWNDKLRTLANAREERERSQQQVIAKMNSRRVPKRDVKRAEVAIRGSVN
jgi:hypothetical protein